MKHMLELWKADKLKGSLQISWLLTVFASFWGSEILSVQIPAIGAMFPFRVLVPISAVLYLIWAIREKENPWKTASFMERMCYVLICVLLVYGTVSLVKAIDFGFTFRRLFNLCFDLCFFFLMLRLCRDRKLFGYTVWTAVAAVVLLTVMGVYEVFCGGIFNDKYNNFKIFTFFNGAYQLPIVTASNANDFIAMLMFVLALALLIWAEGSGKKHAWLPVFMLPAMYLLIRAADSRLIEVGFWLLVAGVAICNLVTRKKRAWVAVVTLVLILCVNVGQEYYRIKPVVQNYLAKTAHAIHLMDDDSVPETEAKPEKPALTVDVHAVELKEQFYEVNEETGEVDLSTTYSAGKRVRLLVFAFDCFMESKGMGVGLGNTEQLAKVDITEKTEGIWAIHCFIARLIADFGIWVLIPLAILGIGLLWQGLRQLLRSLRKREIKRAAFWLLYLLVLFGFPFVSTASADAQDIISMWLYLAGVVLIPVLDQQAGGRRVPESLDTPAQGGEGIC